MMMLFFQKKIQPCLDFIDIASKQRWKQVQYSNIRDIAEPWEVDYYNKNTWERHYHSLWKSLDSEAILYIMSIAGDGFICLDTKENALVAGVEASQTAVVAMDFDSACYGVYGSGPFMHLFPKNPEVPLKKAPETQLSIEEAKRHMGVIEVERAFLHFKRLIISFLYGGMELYESDIKKEKKNGSTSRSSSSSSDKALSDKDFIREALIIIEVEEKKKTEEKRRV